MTLLLTRVLATVKQPVAFVVAPELANPHFFNASTVRVLVDSRASLIIVSVAAENVLLFCATHTTCFHPYLAAAAQAFVALTLTSVLATWHRIPTKLTTAPATRVVGVDTLRL